MRLFNYRPDFTTGLVFLVLLTILLVLTMEMWAPHGLH